MRWMSAKNEPPDSWVIVLAAYEECCRWRDQYKWV
jgi:hypothetical protein